VSVLYLLAARGGPEIPLRGPIHREVNKLSHNERTKADWPLTRGALFCSGSRAVARCVGTLYVSRFGRRMESWKRPWGILERFLQTASNPRTSNSAAIMGCLWARPHEERRLGRSIVDRLPRPQMPSLHLAEFLIVRG
jgi:hypothetical protein